MQPPFKHWKKMRRVNEMYIRSYFILPLLFTKLIFYRSLLKSLLQKIDSIQNNFSTSNLQNRCFKHSATCKGKDLYWGTFYDRFTALQSAPYWKRLQWRRFHMDFVTSEQIFHKHILVTASEHSRYQFPLLCVLRFELTV